MSEPYLSEIEARLTQMRRDMEYLRRQVVELAQQLPRAWQQGNGSGGGDGKVYFAVGDGLAQATGTWPSISPGTFVSDVYDGSSGTLTLVASGATVYWFDVDALATSGTIVKCTRNQDGTYTGLLESCTAVA